MELLCAPGSAEPHPRPARGSNSQAGTDYFVPPAGTGMVALGRPLEHPWFTGIIQSPYPGFLAGRAAGICPTWHDSRAEWAAAFQDFGAAQTGFAARYPGAEAVGTSAGSHGWGLLVWVFFEEIKLSPFIGVLYPLPLPERRKTRL